MFSGVTGRLAPARLRGAEDLFFFFFFFPLSCLFSTSPAFPASWMSLAGRMLGAGLSVIFLSLSWSPPPMRSTSCSFEGRFFCLWGHFWDISPGMTSRNSL